MADQRVAYFKQALSGQFGGGLGDIRVYTGVPRYQYGQGFGDVLRNIFKSFIPVAMNVGKSFFNSGSAALDSGQSLGDAMKATIRPTLSSALKHGSAAIGKAIEGQEGGGAAPPSGPSLLYQDDRDVGMKAGPQQLGTGGYKRKSTKRSKTIKSYARPSYNYNF